MPRIKDLPTVATAGAKLVANSSADAAGLVATSEFALASETPSLDMSTVSTDADFTLTWGTSSETIRHTGTLTSDRAVTLSTTGAVTGARFKITRTGSGAFNLNVGTGPLKALTQNMWAEFRYDGSAWYLAEHGITNMSAFAQTLLDDANAAAMKTTLGIPTISAFAETFLDDADAAAVRATLGISNGAMIQISKQTVSSPVSAVTFTGIPSSGYSHFILVGVEVVSAVVATTGILYIQVSTDNGSTFKTTSGDYYTNGATAVTYLTRTTVPGASSTYQHGNFVLHLFGLGNASRATTGVKAAPTLAGTSTTNIDTSLALVNDHAMRTVVETDNAFRVVPSSAVNISSGTFILYGVTET